MHVGVVRALQVSGALGSAETGVTGVRSPRVTRYASGESARAAMSRPAVVVCRSRRNARHRKAQDRGRSRARAPGPADGRGEGLKSCGEACRRAPADLEAAVDEGAARTGRERVGDDTTESPRPARSWSRQGLDGRDRGRAALTARSDAILRDHDRAMPATRAHRRGSGSMRLHAERE